MDERITKLEAEVKVLKNSVAELTIEVLNK